MGTPHPVRRAEDSAEFREAKAAKEKWDHAWKMIMTGVMSLLTAAIIGATKTVVDKFDKMTEQQAQHAAQLMEHTYEVKSLRSDVTVIKAQIEAAATKIQMLEAIKRIEDNIKLLALTTGPSKALNTLHKAVRQEVEHQERTIGK